MHLPAGTTSTVPESGWTSKDPGDSGGMNLGPGVTRNAFQHCHESGMLAALSRAPGREDQNRPKKSPEKERQLHPAPPPPSVSLSPRRGPQPRWEHGLRPGGRAMGLRLRAVPLSFRVSSRIFLTASRALLSLFPAMITCMPSLARCFAVAKPMPSVPPVTMATRPGCGGKTAEEAKRQPGKV